jgi:P-type conjugative transfer protein TrbG
MVGRAHATLMKPLLPLGIAMVLASAGLQAADAGAATPLVVPPAAPVAPQRDPRQDTLSPKEAEGLELAKQWLAAKDELTLGANGQVKYLFGATLPTIICAPLHVTDIALQPGEVIKEYGVHAGDTVRWQIAPAVSGPASNQTTHLIIKPGEVGLRTDLIVATDRRTYQFELLSRRDDWMPSVGFSYPEEIQSEWDTYQAQIAKDKAANTLPETGENLTALDFRYRLDGNAAWKPVRVYSTGIKTVIQMPAQMKASESPALLVLGDGGKEEMVNYRVRGDRYIVDLVFTKAVLISGVGHHQTRVTIMHEAN